ncbi:unnamed protein product [Bursaphelenchus xylophilus]|uniref:(pine wood nematode) hypothetical protein n=1 Tax=Bursaphelenchus xylophilus TaxID=6326 RepID=A0A1I7S6K8_BURXY|nr:unnamed protein product [Bursaphelenchus xylophilus]CAG9120524.1 unnamed protein product [Bursaphelenchus xylophilus]
MNNLDSAMTTFYRASLLVLTCIYTASGLSCYSNEEGMVTTIDSPEIKFCAVIPERIDDDGKVDNAHMFGLTNDDIAVTEQTKIDALLNESNDGHSVVAICMHEKYDMYKLVINSGQVNPKIAAQTLLGQQGSNYVVRCVCNTDLCNKGATVDDFYRSQRSV